MATERRTNGQFLTWNDALVGSVNNVVERCGWIGSSDVGIKPDGFY